MPGSGPDEHECAICLEHIWGRQEKAVGAHVRCGHVFSRKNVFNNNGRTPRNVQDGLRHVITRVNLSSYSLPVFQVRRRLAAAGIQSSAEMDE